MEAVILCGSAGSRSRGLGRRARPAGALAVFRADAGYVFADDFDLAGALASTLGPNVVVENDCNLAVLAERWCGAAGELAFLGAFEVENGARGIAQTARELSGSPLAERGAVGGR
jgi:predicted NBD/HSP70 family sugar kinase